MLSAIIAPLAGLAGNVADMSARHGDVGNFFQKRHVAATHDTQKEAPTHSFCVSFCRHHTEPPTSPPHMPLKKKRGGGGGPTTTTAAAAASAADDNDDMVSLPPVSKEMALAKTRAIDAVRANAAAQKPVRPRPRRMLPPMTTMTTLTLCPFLL